MTNDVRHDCQFDNVVLANGDYPRHETSLRVLSHAEVVVCCDGAAAKYLSEGGHPTAIVGDGDSLSPELKERYASICHFEKEQETNDLSKAVRYLMAQGKRKFAILGATGKRDDHTLGNVSLLVEYMRQGAEVRMFTDYGVFIPCHDNCSFAVHTGQQVSIINFCATGIKGQGLKYPLYDFTNWWQGTLNEAVGEQVTIKANGDWLVYFPY